MKKKVPPGKATQVAILILIEEKKQNYFNQMHKMSHLKFPLRHPPKGYQWQSNDDEDNSLDNMIIHADLPVDVGIKDDEEDNGVDNMIDEADFPVGCWNWKW